MKEKAENAASTVLSKLLKARKIIKESSIKKDGFNPHSKYNYFTPDQVSSLVDNACQVENILPIFSLKKDELGLFGELTVVDVENGDYITTIMRTEMPSITATNDTQKMGGCETYTKRYMLMSMFDIADNNLDFDSQDNRGSKPKEATVEKPRTLTKKRPSKEESGVVDEKVDKYREIIGLLMCFETPEQIKEGSLGLLNKASEYGLDEETVKALKLEINKRYSELKSSK